MAPPPDAPNAPAEPRSLGLGSLISTTVVLSFGISILAAIMLVAVGMWLDR